MGCKFYRIGFETDTKRDSHVESHDRPFKCAVSNCDFASIGFRSNAQLHQHSLKCHGNQIISFSSTTPSVYDINNLESQDLDAVLIDAVKAGEVHYVRDMCGQLPPKKLEQLMGIAVASSTTSMVEMLLAHGANVKSHDRPFKCAFLNCDFASIGFRSNAQLHQHSLKYHGNQITLSLIDYSVSL
jgi:hypothetical protein